VECEEVVEACKGKQRWLDDVLGPKSVDGNRICAVGGGSRDLGAVSNGCSVFECGMW